METLILSKPFKLQNEKEINELTLNFEELSTADLRQIKKLETVISDAMSIDVTDMAKPKGLTFEFQLSSGFLAAVKGTNGLQIGDFTRLPMNDALKLARISSFFWLGVD